MAHPNARKGAMVALDPGNPRSDYQGEPDFMPPVLVYDADQLEYYQAQGYDAAGECSEEAFNRLTAAPTSAAHVPVEYPKWVGEVLVNDAAEERALKKPSAKVVRMRLEAA